MDSTKHKYSIGFFHPIFSSILWISVFFFSSSIFAQYIQFEPIYSLPSVIQTQDIFFNCDVYTQEFGDVDGDNDQDLIIIGSYTSTDFFTKLYLNDGLGNLTEMLNSPFEEVNRGSIAFSDIDNDTDLDVIISGKTENTSIYSTNLYVNDGQGNFTLLPNTPFEKISQSIIVFSDIDNDIDQDVIISGVLSNGQLIAKIYKNAGNGNFTLSQDMNSAAVTLGAIAFADIDNDFDQDILITGANASNQPTSKMFMNNGNGIYQEILNTLLEPVKESSIAFVDIDNDFDQDVLITGLGLNNLAIAKLYLNVGNNQFSVQYNNSFTGVYSGSVLIRDFDNDSDVDVFISGYLNSGPLSSRLYSNIGNGEFAVITGTPFLGAGNAVNSAVDIDNDNDLDILITGYNYSPFSIFYINNGNNSFSEDSNNPIENFRLANVSHADIDGDSDEDFVVSGLNQTNSFETQMYINDGNGNYLPNTTSAINFDGVSRNFLKDVDNDSDPDLILSRTISTTNFRSTLYLNDGSGNFNFQTNSIIEDSSTMILQLIDLDNDTDVDIIARGNVSTTIKTYLNDGNGNFTLYVDSPFENMVSILSNDMADVDNDGDQDIMLIGSNSNAVFLNLFLNDGFGQFTLGAEFPTFTGINASNIAFADIDTDSDVDLFVMGSISNQIISKFLINDGNGNFIVSSQNVLDGKLFGSIDFADIDNDQDLDVILTGQNSVSQQSTTLYTNDGEGNFEVVDNVQLLPVYFGSSTFFDCTNDNKVDLLLIGSSSLRNVNSILYKNLSCTFSQITPSQAVLPQLISPCSISEITAPTAIDNCVGLILGITSYPFPIVSSGIHEIQWTFDNGYGNIVTQNQYVEILLDTVAPIPQLSSLPILHTNCQISTLTIPFAVDNCLGLISGNTAVQLPISSLDTTIITWSYDDQKGNISTQTQLVVITQSDSIIPNQISLPLISSNCEVTGIDPPTASFNCDTNIIASTDAVLPITNSGITEISWIFSDGNGNTTIQNQLVEIEIDTVPVPLITDLPTIFSTCPIDSLQAPLAKFNCEDTIVATTNISFPIQSGDTTFINWIYESDQGIITEQQQLVIISDTIKPIPIYEILPNLLITCELTELNPPPAYDNCAGTIYATTDFSLPLSIEGNYTISWTYEDGNGNSIIQNQNLILQHSNYPIPNQPVLPEINSICKINSLVPPTATFDCSQVIIGTPNITFPIGEGSTNIIWSFDAGNGFVSTQHQIVNIQDEIAPEPEISNLPPIYLDCESLTSLVPPTAIDNCVGLIYATTNAQLPISNATTITWTFSDGNGNLITQNQSVLNSSFGSVDNSVLQVDELTFLATASGYSYQWVNCDSNQWINGATNQLFTAVENGNYSVIISGINCSVPLAISPCLNVNSVGLSEVENTSLKIFPNPTNQKLTIQSNSEIRLILVKDVDGKLIEKVLEVNDLNYTLDFDSLCDGIYYIEIISETSKQVERVIKQR